jgi:hypothetical protein
VCRQQNGSIACGDKLCVLVCACSTGLQQLDNGCSAFERGGVDVCEFTAPDVGHIAGVALATDASCTGGMPDAAACTGQSDSDSRCSVVEGTALRC